MTDVTAKQIAERIEDLGIPKAAIIPLTDANGGGEHLVIKRHPSTGTPWEQKIYTITPLKKRQERIGRRDRLSLTHGKKPLTHHP